MKINRFVALAAITLAAVVALAGCGANAQISQPADAAPTTAATAGEVVVQTTATPIPTASSFTKATTPVPIGRYTPVASSSLPPYNPVIDPAAFTTKITNPLFPLPPGTTYLYKGTRDGVPRQDEVTFTTEIKTIMGVDCIVVRDVVTSNNALVEKTTDWYAQDTAGNVWYFGEDTAEYENGAVTSTAGTWMAGVDGALPGLIMKAAPAVGDAYRQEYRPGEAEDFAKVLQLNAAVEIPAGSYTNVVVTQDTDLLDTSKLEHKFYAPGVGYLGSTGIVNGHNEEIMLSSILKSGG